MLGTPSPAVIIPIGLLYKFIAARRAVRCWRQGRPTAMGRLNARTRGLTRITTDLHTSAAAIN